jgi:hypothetical protein
MTFFRQKTMQYMLLAKANYQSSDQASDRAKKYHGGKVCHRPNFPLIYEPEVYNSK